MKTSNIPAQVIDVEDRISHNLSLNQLIILIFPLIISLIIYFMLPPFSKINSYKIILVVILGTLISSLAIRINHKLVLIWLIILVSYYHRPKYYIFNKNYQYKNQSVPSIRLNHHSKSNQAIIVKKQKIKFNQIPIQELRLTKLNPQFNFSKEGEIYVHLDEK